MKRILLAVFASCWATVLNAQDVWQHSGILRDEKGQEYCQTLSPEGLGVRFYEDNWYTVGFLDVDASSNPDMKKVIDAGEAKVVIQPDALYAYFTTMRHEITERKVVGDQGVQRKLSRFSISGSDYHLIEAMQDAGTLNVIVTDDVSRIMNLTLADVDFSFSLAGSADALEKALGCIE